MTKFKEHKIKEHKRKEELKKRGWLFWSVITIGGGMFIGIMLGVIVFLILYSSAPYNLSELRQAQSTIIMDREGNELFTVHGDVNRRFTPLSKIPPHLVGAFLAIEDDKFYEHIGIDLGGIYRAFMYNIFGIGVSRGGSTITQQLAKNLFFTNERSYKRKILEIISALKIEQNYSKDEVFEYYLNTITFSGNAHGPELASQLFFGKSVSDISIAEAAVLAAVANAPTRYSPYGQNKYSTINVDPASFEGRTINDEEDLELYQEYDRGLLGKLNFVGDNKKVYLKGRVDLVLRRMLDLGYITKNQKDMAWNESQNLEFQPYQIKIKYPHFVMYVKQILEEKHGKDVVERGGLKVYTTIDPKYQDIAEKLVAEIGATNVDAYGANNAALVSLDRKTGQIVAMVGARDYFDIENDGNVNVAIKYRLPGSSFKPFVYAVAFLKGYAPATVIFDLPMDFGGGYKPHNYDGKFRGPVTMRQALGNSLNIPAVKTGYLANIKDVISTVRNMGIDLPQDESWYGLSLSLGAGEVRLLDLVSAYNVFANLGQRKDPVAILKVVDSQGNILEEWEEPETYPEVLAPEAAYLITDVLSDPEARGPGWNRYLQIPNQPVASKTGTANKKIKGKTVPSDAWTVGYSPYLVTGVWAGNNDGSPLNYNGAGLVTAGPIWHEFMTQAHADLAVEEFEKPAGIKWIQIVTTSGKHPSKNTPVNNLRSEIFADFNIPTEVDHTFVEMEVDAVTGLLPSKECPTEALEKRIFVDYHSLKPDKPNWENPVLAWVKNHFEEGSVIPTKKCSISDTDPRLDKPRIIINSPEDGGDVGYPSFSVWPKINSKNKIKQVEFFIDDELVDTEYSYPYKGSIPVSEGWAVGSVHQLKVKVLDEYYSIDIDNIKVVINKDTNDPLIKVVYPVGNSRFVAGSSVKIQVEASDKEGEVDQVVYYLDNNLLARKIKYPFNLNLVVPQKKGDHNLSIEVYDKAGNSSSIIYNFRVGGGSGGSKYSLDIFEPEDGAIFTTKQDMHCRVFINPQYLEDLDKIILWAKNSSGQTITLGEINNFTNNTSGLFDFSCPAPVLGEYTLQAKSFNKNNQVTFSRKINIVVD